MMDPEKTMPETYLKSGTNELKIMEYSVADLRFGLNILKTDRVVNAPETISAIPQSHPSVRGVIMDLGRIVPIIDLGVFLGLREPGPCPPGARLLITEFFGKINGFLIDSVHYVHTILWEKVFDAEAILGDLGSDYVIGIVRPTDDRNILLLDYERIILELGPETRARESDRMAKLDIDGANRRILVAEDSAAVRNMLEVELSEKGFQVVVAKDGNEALAIFESQGKFDLVVTDVEMPQLEGLSLTARLKQISPDTPVIVYSSIGDLGMKERAKFVKADAHITKLDMDELTRTIAKHLIRNIAKLCESDNEH